MGRPSGAAPPCTLALEVPLLARKQSGIDVVRHEEELLKIDTAWKGIGYLKARKLIDTVKVKDFMPRDVEHVDIARVAPTNEDSGKIETLDDGSISIPIFEEQVIVTKRIVLKERVIVSKRTVTERERIKVELRREHVSIDADPEVEVTQEEPPNEPLSAR